MKKNIKKTYQKKKFVFYLIPLFLMFLKINVYAATDYLPNEIENNTYIIGSYLFNRDKSYDELGKEIYKGYLTTDYIMLASQSITSNNLKDMIIYYKSITGIWKNAITNEEIKNQDLPEEFSISHKNGKLLLNNVSYKKRELEREKNIPQITEINKIYNTYEYYLLNNSKKINNSLKKFKILLKSNNYNNEYNIYDFV